MTYSIIGILATLILLVINRDVLWNLNGSGASRTRRCYRQFLVGVLIYYITDILWGLLDARRLTVLQFADTTVHFLAMVAAVLLWTRYVVVYLKNDNRFGALLAEDVAINAEIMVMVLSMREMEADVAENGRVAVELFQSREPGWYDAILMDMRMPEMDGLEATRAIRAMDRPDAQAIPIIALTANAFDEDVQRSLQAGLNAHLSKPVEPEALYETLESLIGEK